MRNLIRFTSDVETGVEDLVEAGTSIEEEGATSSTISVLMESLVDVLIAAGQVLIEAAIVGVIGWYVIKAITKWLNGVLERSKMDEGTAGFLSSVVKTALRVLLVVIVIGVLGIPMSSIVAVIGSAGLAIGLALQGALTNFAGGVLILVVKPFKVGDYIIIDSNGDEGTVTSIEVIYTKLLTPDNQSITVPNGTLADSTIINMTNETKRRLDFDMSISLEEDIDRVREVLLKIGNESPYTMMEEERKVIVKSFNESSMTLSLRIWVKSDDYWDAKWELQEKIKKEFDRNEIRIPYNQVDVHMSSGNTVRLKKEKAKKS